MENRVRIDSLACLRKCSILQRRNGQRLQVEQFRGWREGGEYHQHDPCMQEHHVENNADPSQRKPAQTDTQPDTNRVNRPRHVLQLSYQRLVAGAVIYVNTGGIPITAVHEIIVASTAHVHHVGITVATEPPNNTVRRLVGKEINQRAML